MELRCELAIALVNSDDERLVSALGAVDAASEGAATHRTLPFKRMYTCSYVAQAAEAEGQARAMLAHIPMRRVPVDTRPLHAAQRTCRCCEKSHAILRGITEPGRIAGERSHHRCRDLRTCKDGNLLVLARQRLHRLHVGRATKHSARGGTIF